MQYYNELRAAPSKYSLVVGNPDQDPKPYVGYPRGGGGRTPESPLRGRSTDRKVDIQIIFRPNSMSLYGLWELPLEKIGKIEKKKKSYFLIIAYHGD